MYQCPCTVLARASVHSRGCLSLTDRSTPCSAASVFAKGLANTRPAAPGGGTWLGVEGGVEGAEGGGMGAEGGGMGAEGGGDS